MARDKNLIVSGFVGMNTGNIENCHTKMNLKIKKGQSGFCGVNTGTIHTSFSECKFAAKKNLVGFCNHTKGITDCFFISGNLNPEKIRDKKYGVRREDIKSILEKSENWKKEGVWEYQDGVPQIKNKVFSEKAEKSEKVIKISTENELREIAGKVNGAEDDFVYAFYELQNDIDLRGKKWTPIGLGEMSPFCGTFNGNGFTIRNFIVKEKKSDFSGLFGYIDGGVIENLSVDGIVHGGKYAGIIAGMNNGKILGCYGAVRGDAKYCFGGLVGKNSGIISNCYSTGIVRKPFHVLMVSSIGSGAMVMAAVGVAIYIHGKGGKNGGVSYPAIPVSEEAMPIQGDNDKPVSGGNSIQYEMNTNLTCKKGNGEVSIQFKNPGKSNHNIVIMLQITDAELKSKIGRTGRSKEEQAKLEQDKSYNEETNRITLATSGSVKPGYQLETLKLEKLQDGTVLPKGTYEAIVYLTLYDIKSNEKAMVNSQMPVTLVVKG